MSGITHAKVSAKSDGPDSSLILPSDWNAGHVLGRTQLGNTSVAATTDTATTTLVVAKKVTPSVAGLITGIEVYAKGNSSNVQTLSAFIMDDNSGTPGKLVAFGNPSADSGANLRAYNAYLTSTARWITLPVLYWAAASTPIWLVVLFGNNCTLYYDSTSPTNTDYRASPGSNVTYANDGSSFSAQTRTYSIAATLLA